MKLAASTLVVVLMFAVMATPAEAVCHTTKTCTDHATLTAPRMEALDPTELASPSGQVHVRMAIHDGTGRAESEDPRVRIGSPAYLQVDVRYVEMSDMPREPHMIQLDVQPSTELEDFANDPFEMMYDEGTGSPFQFALPSAVRDGIEPGVYLLDVQVKMGHGANEPPVLTKQVPFCAVKKLTGTELNYTASEYAPCEAFPVEPSVKLEPRRGIPGPTIFAVILLLSGAVLWRRR